MNILILGSTSGIGQSVAHIFAEGNNIILVGRSKNKLKTIEKNLILKGAINVKIFKYDFGKDLDYLKKFIENMNIHLIINMASATSSLRDNNVSLHNLERNTNVDLINPILLIQHLIDRNNKLNVIFISSILSKINSPNRTVYSSFKNLQEIYLNKIARSNSDKLYLLTVMIGTEIKKDKESIKSRALAKKILNAYSKGKKNIFFGFSGRLLYFIYYLNPILFRTIIYLKRKIIPFNKTEITTINNK